MASMVAAARDAPPCVQASKTNSPLRESHKGVAQYMGIAMVLLAMTVGFGFMRIKMPSYLTEWNA
ncbi:hypothetical protein EON67_03070 [archaeon]|nr:MAG: hypothetical protein EON67_03070 [archaeon]